MPRVGASPVVPAITIPIVNTPSSIITNDSCLSAVNKGNCSAILTNGPYTFVTQNDGNVVAYKDGKSFWQSNTISKGIPPYKLIMKEDGNLVLYDSQDNAQWATNTSGKGISPYKLVMQTDGNVVIYDANNDATWIANTPIVTPIVTPVVTPVVTPIVTPVVTPIITPVVTPIVTPIPQIIYDQGYLDGGGILKRGWYNVQNLDNALDYCAYIGSGVQPSNWKCALFLMPLLFSYP